MFPDVISNLSGFAGLLALSMKVPKAGLRLSLSPAKHLVYQEQSKEISPFEDEDISAARKIRNSLDIQPFAALRR